jgi:dual specificity tyrosine-phosphorylation-regulated kinase 2/3/4
MNGKLVAINNGASTARAPATVSTVDPRDLTGPFNGADASRYPVVIGALSSYEKTEIGGYETVYYYGQNCLGKIMAPVAGKPNAGYDDDRGDMIIIAKDHMLYRYELLSVLGRGSFGQVIKAIDHKTGQTIALKIIRNKKRFHTQAEVEVRVLQHLKDRDPDGKYGIIKMLETFVFRNHVCIVYELLSMNLYEHMKLNKFQPMPLPVVRKIAASVLISLAFMWRENIIHCDLKPENILLRQPGRHQVKVIDLGSACFEEERLYKYIQSRFYRAPEVILELGYTKRIDLWSYACVLAELASGYPLFAGENETEQLACMMEYLGPPPRYLIDASPRKNAFFDAHGSPILVPNSKKKIREPNTKSLAGFLGLEHDDHFIGFLMMFLQYDPDDRPAPEVSMRHPWICEAYVGLTPKIPVVNNRRSRLGSDSSSLGGGGGHGLSSVSSDRRASASSAALSGSNMLNESGSEGPSKPHGGAGYPLVPTGVGGQSGGDAFLPDIHSKRR